MAQTVRLRRSALTGATPTNAQLELGELALNTTDGKAFMAKSGSGGPSVEEFIITNTVNFGDVHISGDTYFDGDQYLTGSLDVTGNITATQPITASLFGTASYAEEALTASYSLNALTSSFAITSSYALNSAQLGGVAPSSYTLLSDTDSRWSAIKRVGFLDRSQSTMSFDDGTYTLTLSPTSSSYEVMFDGKIYTITGNKSIQIANPPTPGQAYYVTMDDTSGTLGVSTSVWTFDEVAVAIIYFNSDLTPTYILFEERHGTLFDAAMHSYLHQTQGTKLLSGGAISGYAVGTNTDAANSYAIADASITDEDIELTVSGITDGNGAVSDNYMMMYRTGTTWLWEYSDMPFIYTPAGYINYNPTGTTLTQGTGGAGGLQRYYNTFVFFTDSYYPEFSMISVLGQEEHTSADEAYAETIDTLDLSGFPAAEWVAMYQITWMTGLGTLTNKGKVQMSRAPLLIQTSALGVSTATTEQHNSLSGLQGGNGTTAFWHLDEDDYNEAILFFDSGSYTHSDIDTHINDGTIHFTHTAGQTDVDNAGGNVIQDINMDTYGHISGTSSIDLDTRYYTETESDSRFVNVTGDTMSGNLNLTSAGVSASFFSGAFNGNLTGTASFADQATSSSYALNATSSSYALNSTSASYALTATSASHALNANTASYVDYGNIDNPPTIGNGSITVEGGNGLTGSDSFTVNQTGNSTITLHHADTSGQASSDNSGNTVIQDVLLDTYGHITGLTTATITNVTSASYADDALSASYSLSSTSASYALTTTSSSYALNTTSSSYALNATTSSYSLTATSSSHAINADTASYIAYGNIDGTPTIGNGQITIEAGNGLTGTESFTVNQTGNSTITLNHADTSNEVSSDNSGNTVIQDVLIDTFGHITGLTTATISSVTSASYANNSDTSTSASHAINADTASYVDYSDIDNTPTIGDGTITVEGGDGLSGSTNFTVNQTGNTTITIVHDDTSSEVSSDNSGNTVIQNVLIDGYGHITGLTTATITTVTSSSYADDALSASYSLNSTSASYALTATSSSYALNATSSSYALNATSSSYALTATSSSHAVNADTSSYVDYGNIDNLPNFDATYVNVNGDTMTDDLIVSGNITVTGYLGGPGGFTIDPAPIGTTGGTVYILGNLQVEGTTTSVNSTEVNIVDKNILLASGSTSNAEANGAGLTIDGSNATLIYASANDRWEVNKSLATSNQLISTVTTGTAPLLVNSTTLVSNLNAEFANTASYIAYGNIDGTPTIGDGTITVEGGAGLSGSDSFTTNQTGNTTITLTHADTSSEVSSDNSGNTVIQDILIDGYGHITGLTTATITTVTSASYADDALSASYALNATSSSYALNSTSASYALNATSSSHAINANTASYVDYTNVDNTPTIGDGTITVEGSLGLSGSTNFTVNQAGNTTVTLVHDDTSSQTSTSNSGNFVIQNISLDDFGHITGLTTTEITGTTGGGSVTLDSGSINYQENIDVDTGAEVVATAAIADYDAAFFDYVVKSGTNVRAGRVTAAHDGTSVEYTETSTTDLGDTSAVSLSVDISGGDLRLIATTTSDNWLVKAIVTAL